MITREDYLNALELIDQYHRQSDSNSVRRNLNWEYLQVGDNIVFDKVISKDLTKGKEYIVLSVSDDFKLRCQHSRFDITNFEIADDRGRIKRLCGKPKGYIVRRVK